MCPSKVPDGEQRGWIIPIGGAEDKEARRRILKRFVQLSGGRDARIVIIPTASRLADTGARIRATVPVWRAALARGDARRRPAPQTWSPLEYGCHVRDVHVLFAERLRAMLDEDEPTFANWDQDATAVERRYAEADPAVVSTDLLAAAAAVADLYDAVPADAHDRPGFRSNGSAFTVDSIARYHLHDVVHHLHDVGAGWASG